MNWRSRIFAALHALAYRIAPKRAPADSLANLEFTDLARALVITKQIQHATPITRKRARMAKP